MSRFSLPACTGLLTLLLLTGCQSTTPEEVFTNFLLWILYLMVMAVVVTIGAMAALTVLLAPPFAGLVSGMLLRRDASWRRRRFIVTVGFLNLSNFGLFVWPWVAVVEEALVQSAAATQETLEAQEAPSSGDDAAFFAVLFTALLLVNLAVGIYSLAVGLRRSEPLP